MFRTWMRETRGKRSQAECARLAGMKPQYWGWLEKYVDQPDEETVKKVAMGLQVSEAVAMTVAGYTDSSVVSLDAEVREVTALLADTPEPHRPALMQIMRTAQRSFKSVANHSAAA